MKLQETLLKVARKAQGSINLEYLAEQGCEYKNVYMGSRNKATNV